MLRLSVGALLVGAVLGGCSFPHPNSGILGASVIGIVSSADGSCVNAGPNFFNGDRDEPTCFAGKVGQPGQCVEVTTYTPAVTSNPPYRFPVGRVITLSLSRCG